MHSPAGVARPNDAFAVSPDALQQRRLMWTTPMRVLIVDDHRIVASGCRALFADDDGIEILEASDAESGEQVFVAEEPDICVLDINLPTVSGFELARRILAHASGARIIMFSMNDDPVFAARAIEVGAKG